jgi:hypothetical protein
MGIDSEAKKLLEARDQGIEITAPKEIGRQPTPLVAQVAGKFGAVLFVNRDSRDGSYRSLVTIQERGQSGAWHEIMQGGGSWFDDALNRPKTLPGGRMVEIADVQSLTSENLVLYCVTGRVTYEVNGMTFRHRNRDGLPCSIESSSGAFLALGELSTSTLVRLRLSSSEGQQVLEIPLP